MYQHTYMDHLMDHMNGYVLYDLHRSGQLIQNHTLHHFQEVQLFLLLNHQIQELMNPENINQYTVSRVYLNNLLELLEICNPAEKEYNLLAYEYIINSNDLTGKIKIIENYNEPSYRIVEIDGSDLTQYLKEKQIGVTISGTLFKTHETELSIFYDFLNELYSLRKHYKKQMYNYVENSPEFNEFNRRQLTTKVIMNSTYGLLGMSSFRYSNKWLAKTITTSGRISLKTAQYFAEKYLDLNFS